MARLRITNLPKDVEISKDEMRRLRGGHDHARWIEMLSAPESPDGVQYRETDSAGRCDHADF